MRQIGHQIFVGKQTQNQLVALLRHRRITVQRACVSARVSIHRATWFGSDGLRCDGFLNLVVEVFAILDITLQTFAAPVSCLATEVLINNRVRNRAADTSHAVSQNHDSQLLFRNHDNSRIHAVVSATVRNSLATFQIGEAPAKPIGSKVSRRVSLFAGLADRNNGVR